MVSERGLAKAWNSNLRVSRILLRAERTIWCTPTKGLSVAAARVFAAFEHTLRQPAIP